MDIDDFDHVPAIDGQVVLGQGFHGRSFLSSA
jgi:hypothetical protein